jgi:hypothetical protein
MGYKKPGRPNAYVARAIRRFVLVSHRGMSHSWAGRSAAGCSSSVILSSAVSGYRGKPHQSRKNSWPEAYCWRTIEPFRGYGGDLIATHPVPTLCRRRPGAQHTNRGRGVMVYRWILLIVYLPYQHSLLPLVHRPTFTRALAMRQDKDQRTRPCKTLMRWVRYPSSLFWRHSLGEAGN